MFFALNDSELGCTDVLKHSINVGGHSSIKQQPYCTAWKDGRNDHQDAGAKSSPAIIKSMGKPCGVGSQEGW